MLYQKHMFRPSFFTPLISGVLFSFLLALFVPVFQADAMGTAAPLYHVGMRNFGIWEPVSDQRLDFSVWYPSKAEGDETVRDGWRVLSGKPRRILPGLYPLILVSHDTASSRFANNDVYAALASGGMIVVVPTHSGDSQLSSEGIFSADMAKERPRQLLRALETVLGSPDFAPYADESRIGLFGIGVGALTVMQLAGAVPDYSLITDYCRGRSGVDAFCAGWTEERLAVIPAALGVKAAPADPVSRETTKESGKKGTSKKGASKKGASPKGAAKKSAPPKKTLTKAYRDELSPPLALFAPELVPAQPPDPDEAAPAPAPPAAPKRNVSLREFLFGPTDDHDGEEMSAAAAQREEQQAALGASLSMAFQSVDLFGEKEREASFLHIDLPDSFVPPAMEEPAQATVKGGKAKIRKADPRYTAYRRKPDVRRIRAVALMAPAGGMLFAPESLREIVVPVALVEAGQDGLYPPEGHAAPYYSSLRVPPLILQLAGVDHFSLFARCSRDSMLNLGAVCGKLVGAARDEVAEQRDRFLVSFFQSALGGALEPAQPSGFVAKDGER